MRHLCGARFSFHTFPFDYKGQAFPFPGQDVVARTLTFNGSIEAIYHPQGRAVLDGSTWRHEYVITDHLGNTRLRFSDLDGSGTIDSTELLSTHDYYPFGLEWQDSGYKYTYNGKEIDRELGLNWHHYGKRMYDAVLGRFTGVDPISDQFPWVSTFNYAENEPVRHIDLHGLQKYDPQSGQMGPWTNEYVEKGTQGVLFHTAYTGMRSAQIRQQYQNKVASLDAGDSAGRTKAKVEARAKTPVVTKIMAENMRPMSKEKTRTRGTANKSNTKVNKTAGNLGKIGRASGVAGVGISVYNVATAEDKSKAIAEEGGAMAGAIAGGEAGATAGAGVGVWFGGGGAVPGAIIGGVIGSIVGGIAGKEAGRAIHDTVANEKKEEEK